jgi:hypothetical protein
MEGKVFFEMALEEMPTIFIRKDFLNKSVGLGYPKCLTKTNGYYKFLHNHCEWISSKKHWKKIKQ